MQLEILEAEILNKLEMLSEGGTCDLDRPNLHRVHPGSSVPPGVDEDEQMSHLRPEMSLWAYHATRLRERMNSPDSLRLTALAEAEKDYATARKRPPAFIDSDSDQNAADRDEAILRWSGKSAEWVAVFEQCSFSHVRKLRRLHGLNQSTGEPVETIAA